MISSLIPRALTTPDFEPVGWRFLPTGEDLVEVAVMRECKRDPVTGIHKGFYT